MISLRDAHEAGSDFLYVKHPVEQTYVIINVTEFYKIQLKRNSYVIE